MARVLVVEDDDPTREVLEALLGVEGYAVDVAATGADGLRVTHTKSIDIVLCDLRLPDIDGLTVLRHLLADGIELPFVLMTAFSSSSIAFEAGRMGVAAYLEKPVSEEELLRILRMHTPGNGRAATTAIEQRGHTQRALQLIDDRYADPDFDIHTVADVCGITREHLARLIHESIGRSFTDLLRTKRMQEASRLLAGTSLRIKEIYQQVGLTRASDFNHAFKRAWGVTPKTYRQTRMSGIPAVKPRDEPQA